MNKAIQLLGVLAIVQGGILLVGSASREALSTFQPQEALLGGESAAVNEVTIGGGNEEEVRLLRQKGQWVLPVLSDFPANARKVEGVLTKLYTSKRTYPVGRTAVAQKQLKVASDEFERRLLLQRQDDMHEVFLGTSPGFKKAHVRVGTEKEIYALPLPVFDFPTQADAWVDQGAFGLPQQEVRRVVLPSLTLEQKKGALMPGDIGADEKVVQDELEALVAQLEKLRFLSVVKDEDMKKAEAASALYTMRVEMVDGREYAYEFSRLEEAQEPEEGEEKATPKETYYLRSSRLPRTVTIGRGIVEKFRSATRDMLVEAVELEPSAEETAVPSGTGE